MITFSQWLWALGYIARKVGLFLAFGFGLNLIFKEL